MKGLYIRARGGLVKKLSRPDLVWQESKYKRPLGYYIVTGIKILGLAIIVVTLIYLSVKGAN